MTFRTVPVSDIWYDKANRQRRDLGDVSDLAQSIAAVGLINPLVITKDHELIAGERRLTAIKSLGWTHVPVQFREDLSDLDRERIELDENIKRLDLSWQEKVAATARYHELCRTVEGEKWTLNDTADRLGVSQAFVVKQLTVAKALNDERIATAPLFSTALGMVQRTAARKQASETERMTVLLGGEAPTATPTDAGAPFLRADFNEWYHTYTGPKFNLIHCDFPYGIGATENKNNQYAKGFGEYSDNADDFITLIDTLQEASIVIADSAHLIFWYSAKEYSMTLAHLTRLGWTVNPTPFIWHRSDNSGILPDPRRMPRQIYETAFLASRGDRFLVQPRANLIGAANTKEWHMSEKPKAMLEHLLSMFVDDTTRMLDPTCGSGNAVIVAERLGAASVLGLEKIEEFYDNACANWKKENEDV